MNQADLEVTLGEVKDSLVKVGAEIDSFKAAAAADTASLNAAIASLQAELASANGSVSPATEALIAEVKALSAALDAKIDDLPSPAPVDPVDPV